MKNNNMSFNEKRIYFQAAAMVFVQSLICIVKIKNKTPKGSSVWTHTYTWVHTWPPGATSAVTARLLLKIRTGKGEGGRDPRAVLLFGFLFLRRG